MTWKVLYFGESHPSIRKQLKIHLLMFILISSPYGYWGDFAPSNWIFYLGNGIALLLTLVSIFYIFKNMKKLKSSPQMIKLTSRQRNTGLLFLPIVVFCFVGLFFTYSLPAMFTMLIGQDFNTKTLLTKVETTSRKSCKYRVEPKELEGLLPSYICIDKSQFNSQTNEFLLSGKKSILGKLYRSIEQ
ncbi:hypothetical protein [Shewanella nanhaiensis]|uniref:Uncharacterized protein n=1 Tax=Shewanella nanhaiensis TaxID=2864872 RepID=A0ABS7EA04_9GAMM|nr:hypothetical protein [Shewanella nanhaiensis]MBW8185832.1 hypothetical protein [Shewanella nanhaiensis]